MLHSANLKLNAIAKSRSFVHLSKQTPFPCGVERKNKKNKKKGGGHDSRSSAARESLVLNAAAALNKGTGRLVVDGGQSADVTDELLQQCGFNQIRLLRDQGLLSKNHLLSSHGVCGEQTPVDVATVPEVWVIRVLQWEKGGKKRKDSYSWSLFNKYLMLVFLRPPDMSDWAVIQRCQTLSLPWHS